MKAFNIQMAMQYREQVTDLYLHQRMLSQIPEEVFDLPALTSLSMTNNNLEELPSNFKQLARLKKLDLSGNKLYEVPGFFSEFSELEQLDLSGNPLFMGLENIGYLSNLQSLSLQNMLLNYFPEFILKLKKLQELNLPGNLLKKIPNGIEKLKCLRILNLGNNTISRLPKSIGNCTQLEELNCSRNKLSKIPETIGQLERLKYLDLSNNKIKGLPEQISTCTFLRSLDLSNNKISAIPNSIGELKWLAFFDVSHNRIKRIPTSINNCKQLNKLDVSYNQLQKIGISFETFPRLTKINLGSNQLTEIPSLNKGLWNLNISRNRLKKLDTFTEGLQELKYLDISRNDIEQLPTTFRHLQQLRTLKAEGNPIQNAESMLILLTELEDLSGLFYYEKKKRLLRFLKACKDQNVSIQWRPVFYKALSGNKSAFRKAPLPELNTALQFPMPEVEFAARAELLNFRGHPLSQNPLISGSHLAVFGQTWFDLSELKSHLESLGIHFSKQLNTSATHILLGYKPEGLESMDAASVVFLTEKELTNFIDTKKERYLAVSKSKDQVLKLRQLLLNPDEKNVAIAINLLKGGGVPEDLITDLLIAWKMTRSNQLNRKLRKLLEWNVSEAARLAIRQPLGIKGRISEDTLCTNIWKLTANNEFDGSKIARFLMKRYGKGKKYLETYG